MKNLFFLFTAFTLFLNAATAQIVNIPDANFKNALVNSNCALIGTDTIYTDVDTNNDGEIQVSEAMVVKKLGVSGKTIASLNGIEYFTALEYLYCGTNQLTILSVTPLSNLKWLECDYNQLTNLNISGLTNLEWVECYHNQLTSINTLNATSLKWLNCSNNLLTSLDLRSNINFENLLAPYNNLTSLRVDGLPIIKGIDCGHSLLTNINLQGLTSLNYLACNNNQITALNLGGLTGLITVYCNNNQITNLNIQGLPDLKSLYCYSNFLTNASLSLSNLPTLEMLDCRFNTLTALNLQSLSRLKTLYCDNNNLPNLNVLGLNNLEKIFCTYNSLTTLDVSNLTRLQSLYCNNNQISSINMTHCDTIQVLYCQYNQMTTLDLSNYSTMKTLYCGNNPMTNLNIKNGSTQNLSICGNPNLMYVCCDDNEIYATQNKVIQCGYTNCSVSSYCSLTPGGTFYTIQGNSKLDINSNGCDSTDFIFPNMKFNLLNTSGNGFSISNTSGSYRTLVGGGIHILTPILENPTYFNVTPTSVQVTFPTTTSPFIQNFCITPNSTHHDVETTLIPTTSARPGFDANYKIIFKNKGNQTENGVVSFGFDDAKMDMVSTSIVPTTTATGSRTWAYTALKPFETRTIDLVLNINSPMETPAVNAGDVLGFTSNITLGATDELPSDNAAVLNQTVVGSYDPNDKTCSEGRQILLSKVGDFLHYTIRFENTGTANATNIVVKDMIDLAKYDIASLQMLKASHDCRVRILNNNQVEFIFENINLPFTAPNKYGYVTFKIKTKSTLVLGDIATNKAEIFFDYNFPIVTNTASTQVVNVLPVDTIHELYPFEITISPNPVSDILTFKTDASIEKCEIFDNMGRIVETVLELSPRSINVVHLPKGIYFLKVYSKDGFAVRKFVKE